MSYSPPSLRKAFYGSVITGVGCLCFGSCEEDCRGNNPREVAEVGRERECVLPESQSGFREVCGCMDSGFSLSGCHV